MCMTYNGKTNWTKGIKDLLYKYGYGYVWENPNCVSFKTFIPIFKQKIIDCFVQDWHDNLESNRCLTIYKVFKQEFKYEQYLDVIKHTKDRRLLTQLRISAHRLRVESARYGRNRLERSDRTCQIC